MTLPLKKQIEQYEEMEALLAPFYKRFGLRWARAIEENEDITIPMPAMDYVHESRGMLIDIILGYGEKCRKEGQNQQQNSSRIMYQNGLRDGRRQGVKLARNWLRGSQEGCMCYEKNLTQMDRLLQEVEIEE